MLILGIETSCDETSAAVIDDNGRILSNIVSSQTDVHRKYGGVVPELACRKHIENIGFVINEAVTEAGITLSGIDLLAATQGPGLIGALLVGLSTAKAIAYSLKKPLIGVNHLEGHLLSVFLTHKEIEFPFITLIASGGHTNLYYVKNFCEYELLGCTLDDAIGESFDKVAKMLNLGYPGGPVIEEAAKKGSPQAIDFPRAFLSKTSFDFSFSGVKTAVKNYLLKHPDYVTNDVCASFQEAVFDVIVHKLQYAADVKKVSTVTAAGGVASNKTLRERITHEIGRDSVAFYCPPPSLCTDNAAMIAYAGYRRYKTGKPGCLDYLSMDADSGMKI